MDDSLSKSARGNARRECKDLDLLAQFRETQQLPVPAGNPGFKTPRRINQDYKNAYEQLRIAFQKRLDALAQPKSQPPNNLRKRPREDDDDNDDRGKGQGGAITNRQMRPVRT